VLAKRNAKAKAADAAKGQALKEQLLKQQADLRRRLPGGTSSSSASNGGEGSGFTEVDEQQDDGPLPSHWQEVAAPDGDGVYYWNELTDTTSWERPKGTSAAKPPQTAGSGSGSSSSSSSGGGAAGGAAAETLPAGWKRVYHEATGQVMYEHVASSARRWSAPTAEDDKSDIQPKRTLPEYVLPPPPHPLLLVPYIFKKNLRARRGSPGLIPLLCVPSCRALACGFGPLGETARKKNVGSFARAAHHLCVRFLQWEVERRAGQV
jgi:hypothetical protein